MKLSRDGRVTIPAAIRAKLQLTPGAEVRISVRPDGSATLRFKRHGVEQLLGMLRTPGQPTVSIDDMQVRLDNQV